MKRTRELLLLGGLCVALPIAGGCGGRLGDFTLLSTKNIDLANFRTDESDKTKEVSGVDSATQFFGAGSTANMKEAADKAEEGANANSLTNAVIDYTWWDALLITNQTFTVKGNPVVRR